MSKSGAIDGSAPKTWNATSQPTPSEITLKYRFGSTPLEINNLIEELYLLESNVLQLQRQLGSLRGHQFPYEDLDEEERLDLASYVESRLQPCQQALSDFHHKHRIATE